MRRVLAVLCLLAMTGCQAIKGAGSDAIDTLTNPPDQILQALKFVLNWVVQLLSGFFADIASKLGF